jgi:hypothetical protein
MFELIGSYKHSEKKEFDYEEVMEEMEIAAKDIIDKTIEERMFDTDNKPSTNLE